MTSIARPSASGRHGRSSLSDAAPDPPGDGPVSLAALRSLLAGLDRAQRRAVTHAEGPALVVAGPGTGKTEVITRRIAWLVASRHARASEILALTFTERAADEMQARVDVLLPYGQVDTAIHTFHAFGDRLLREHGQAFGLPSEPRVIGRTEAVALLRDHVFELGLDRYRPLADPTRFVGALVDLFARAKEEGVGPEDLAACADELSAGARAGLLRAVDAGALEVLEGMLDEAAGHAEVASAYARYQRLLVERGLIDHGDQVGLAVRLLAERPAIRAVVRRRYRYVVVDEAQDANPQQLELVHAVVGEAGNVVFVGDDDQAIYSFRGAVGHALGGLDERFRGLRHIVLRRNYRSRAPILEAARRLIRHNDPHRLEVSHGLDKTPTVVRRSRKPAGVRHHAFATATEEADWVASEVARRIREGTAPGAIAILVRTNAEARPLLASLDARRVPARFSGASGLLAQREVRDVLALLRTIAAPGGSEDLYAVMAAAPYRVSGEDLAALCEMATRRRRSLWSTCQEVVEQPGVLRLSPDGRSRLERVVADLRDSLALAPDRDAPGVLYSHLRRSGWLASLVGAAESGDERPLRWVARLFEAVRDQADLLADDRVTSVVPALQALLDAGEDIATEEDEDTADEVSVLTVHQAKGLEFGTVFVVGLADGRFPLRGRPARLSLPAVLAGEGAGEDAGTTDAEERRLLYVAMTRARDELILTHAAVGTRGGRRRRPSPFLAEALGADGCAPDPGAAAALDPGRLSTDGPEPGSGAGVLVAPPAMGRPGVPLDLSFSQVDDYLACPLRYRLRHQLRVPTAPNHALVVGNALHQAVAVANRAARRGVEATEEEVMSTYQAHWRSEGFLSREHEDARFESGREALRRYRSRLAEGRGIQVVAVEEPFSVRIEGHRVSGRYDAVLGTSAGVVITDFKSSDVRDVARARQRARGSLQLHLYALAWESQHGRLPDRLALHFLEGDVVGEVTPSAERLDRARQQIGAAAAGIGAGRFEATPGYPACEWCPYRRVCPSAA